MQASQLKNAEAQEIAFEMDQDVKEITGALQSAFLTEKHLPNAQRCAASKFEWQEVQKSSACRSIILCKLVQGKAVDFIGFKQACKFRA